MRLFLLLPLVVVGCKKEPPANKEPAKTVEVAPAPTATPAVAPAPAPDAAAPAPADPPTPALAPKAPPPELLVTRTQFGPFVATGKVTRDALAKAFGVKFEKYDETNGESGEVTAAWAAKKETADDGAVAWLHVDRDGSAFRTSSVSQFRDANGIGPGTKAATLVATIKDLACVNVEDEEPKFDCWSKAAPEIHYIGWHGYKLEDAFTTADLGKSDLEVGLLEWRNPKVSAK